MIESAAPDAFPGSEATIVRILRIAAAAIGSAAALASAPVQSAGAAATAAAGTANGVATAVAPPTACRGTVYLTLDTGNMSQAERIARILREQGVRATFFLANERTPRDDHALDPSWQPYWRARVAEGHAFGSHTFDHVYFRAMDAGDPSRVIARPQFGDAAGKTVRWNAAQVCDEIRRVDERFAAMTGRRLDPFWRAPGGKAPPAVMRAAQACGYRHVFWAPAGFLGDELPSEPVHTNAVLLERALRTIRDGDILMAHLGIWSRKDPFAPMLEPLIAGLRERGFCFATLNESPAPARAAIGKGS